jgi:HEAT repeat protein
MALLKRHHQDATDPPVERASNPAALITMLTSGDTPSERRAAALDLTTVPEAAPDLAAALADETDWQVQEAIVTALTSIGSDQAAQGLGNFITSENVALRNAAIDALRQIGEPARSQVERLMALPDPDARIFAIAILEASHDADARKLLRAALEQDPELNVGLAAVEALSHMGGAEDAASLCAFAKRFPDEEFVAFAVGVACRRITAGSDA